MHHIRTTLAAATGILALSLASCSNANTDPGGTPDTPTGQTTSRPSSDTNAELEVTNPKDLASVSDPCQLLKPQQAQQLGTGNPHPDGQSAWGQATCTWEMNDIELTLTPDTVQGKGLAITMKKQGKTEPDEQINGFPVIEGTDTQTTCAIYVGTSATQVFTVFTSNGLDGKAPPCELAKQASGFVLSNLPPMS